MCLQNELSQIENLYRNLNVRFGITVLGNNTPRELDRAVIDNRSVVGFEDFTQKTTGSSLKSSELVVLLVTMHASVPNNKTGKHLAFIS
jgi:hypothetical protein